MPVARFGAGCGPPARPRVVITKHGRPAAVVLSFEDLESLEETHQAPTDAGLWLTSPASPW